MNANACLRPPIATLLAACIGIAVVAVPIAQSQDLSGPERRRTEDMLRGVRTQVETYYYDSTYTGLDLSAVYDSAAERIRRARALDDALAAIAWFTLELHDSHTYFSPPPRTVQAEYGWEMRMVGDSCFVFGVKPGSDAERQGVHRGDRIESINGLAPTRENLWQISYLFWVLSPRPSLRVIVRAPKGDRRALDLAAKVRERGRIMDVTGADGGRDIGQLIREGERDADELKGLTLEAGPDILIWKMPTFEIPLDAVRDALRRTRDRKALVLDLRGNGGGYERVMLELVGQLSRDDVVVGKTRERGRQSPLIAKGAGRNAFAGQLYVLVDSRSASASEILARTVQLTGRGKVLGDRTAGAVMRARYHPLKLGMETATFYGVQVTEADLVMSDDGRLEGVGVTPDLLVLPSASDLAAGRDVVLAQALTLAGMPTDPDRAGTLYRRKSP
jgi:C-terminal processing protease CtpA/Prc